MLMIFYVFLAWVLTPFIYEWVNRRMTADMTARYISRIKGWPAWVVNVIICFLVALLVTALPGGWVFTFTSVFLLTCIIFFGNQAFFTFAIKPFVKTRKG